MSVQCGLYSSNILLLWDFGMYSFDYQHWEIFRNNSPIFVSNSSHQAKVCVYLGLFLVLSRSLSSMPCLFSVCDTGYPSCSRYHSYFNILVHVRCNIQYVVARKKMKKQKLTFWSFLYASFVTSVLEPLWSMELYLQIFEIMMMTV